MDEIKKTLNEMGTEASVVSNKDAINFAMPILSKFYNEVNPNITTSNFNVLYFNSTEDIEDNAFFAQLINTYQQKSSTFQNLINLRKNMLTGDGLELADPNSPNAQATLDFLNKTNTFNESLQDIWNKISFDYSLFECYTLELIYNANGKVVEIIHIDPSTVRAKANDNPNIPYCDTFYLSRNWAYIANKNYKRYTATNSAVVIPTFNPVKFAENGGRQLMYTKRYNAGNNFYAIPSFMAVLPYAELEYQLSQYHLGTVSKGFFPQVIVSLAGNPSDEEKTKFVNQFKNKYSGADKEKILFIWTTNSDEKPEIIPFQQATQDNSIFEILNNITTQKIASGMGANAELAGIQSDGASLGGDANKLSVSYNYYYTTVIRPMQKVMLEAINKIMKLNGLDEVTVATPNLQLDTTVEQQAPVNQVNPNA